MLEHGGRLRQAARQYGIPPADWLDLSTGINPQSWISSATGEETMRRMSPEIWSRLPEDDDRLLDAAKAYYDAPNLLPVAGSQAAIQTLPTLFSPRRVGVQRPAYAEHAQAWQKAGHTVLAWNEKEGLDTFDILILVHPNNPTGQAFSREQLLAWHGELAARGGTLVIDEAFIDATPTLSLIDQTQKSGLIVLRSLGKFFGLAGARVGFVAAEATLLTALNERLGPWTISSAARWLAAHALTDSQWQAETRERLSKESEKLAQCLIYFGLPPAGGTPLFQWVKTTRALAVHKRLVERGILTRYFDAPHSLRFGLPGTENKWERLKAALKAVLCAA